MSIPSGCIPGNGIVVVSEVDGSRVSDSTHGRFPRNSWIFLNKNRKKDRPHYENLPDANCQRNDEHDEYGNQKPGCNKTQLFTREEGKGDKQRGQAVVRSLIDNSI
jgi:hypothetical protein